MADRQPGEWLRATLDRLENPLGFVTAGDERIYWLYLVWAILIALVFFLRSAPGKTSLLSFLRFAFPKSVYWSRSARVDYGWFLLSRPLLALILLPAALWIAPTAFEATQTGLRDLLPGLEDSIPDSRVLMVAFTLVGILVTDLAGFVCHYAQHRIPSLWEFHKVHHSAEALTPITVYRMHPVDDLLVLLVSGVSLAALNGLVQFLIIGPLGILQVFGTNIFACAFLLFGANLRHSHLWVDYGPRLSQVLISPAQHQIHHSSALEHRDRNLGLIFACWDKLLGTLYIPDRREDIVYGIGDGEDTDYSNPAKLFWLPFKKLFVSGKHGRMMAGGLVAAGLMALSVASAEVILGADPRAEIVELEALTWTEVEARIAKGVTTVLVPTAGHEQNGPHVILGKHHHVVQRASQDIARALGNALVAPVITYAPEGAIDPREGHMKFSGTISMPPEIFESILEYTARSLRAHGFEVICFVGDSGDNQASQAKVADRLNLEWQHEPTRVLHVGDYYSANGQLEWLAEQGIPEQEVGSHAGVRDTSELLYVHPEGVRRDRLFSSAHDTSKGLSGDPSRASSEIGKKMIELKVQAAVDEIRSQTRATHSGDG